jgi:hypothetical protein
MIRTLRPLLALPLLLALAAPAAAVEPSPEPALYGETPACPPAEMVDGVYVIPKDAPEGCAYIQGAPTVIAEPMPITAPAPDAVLAPCDQAIVDAATSADPIVAPAPCLLPDGTTYDLAARGGAADPDWSANYDQWLEEFKATLAPCAEGTDPADINTTTCLFPDGSIAGPVPVFMAAPGMADDGIVMDKDADADAASDRALLPLLALTAVFAFAILVLVARRRDA